MKTISQKRENKSPGVMGFKVSRCYMTSLLFILIMTIGMSYIAVSQPDIVDRKFNLLDEGFGKGDGCSKDIYAIAVQSDGKIIIGGDFLTYNNVLKTKLARLNPDGSLDKSFDVSIEALSYIYAIYVLPDGKILIGGAFENVHGIPRRNIARLHSDGSVDVSFNPGSGANDWVRAIAVQPDGKILLGGYFTTFNGAPAKSLIRLLPDGTRDQGFITGSGFGGGVESIALMTDGRILAAGGFYEYNGKEVNNLIRLFDDGSTDETFFIGSGPENGGIWTVRLLNDGKILVGGSFRSFNGFNHGGIIRLHTSGAVDSGFNPGAGASAAVTSILPLADGSLWVGGSFSVFNGFDSKYLIKLRANGSRDMSVNLNGGANFRVFALAKTLDDNTLVGGEFTYLNNHPAKRLAVLFEDGNVDSSFNPGNGADGGIRKVVVQQDGSVLLGGLFTSYAGHLANRIVKVQSDGNIDLSFSTGKGAESFGSTDLTTIQHISVQKDQKIIASGSFAAFDGKNVKNIVRLHPDGSTDSEFMIGTGANNHVSATAVQPDDKIIVAGHFTQFNGKAQGRITRLLPSGLHDNTFNVNGLGANSWVECVQVLPNGKILVAGEFATYNGVTVNRIARLMPDGTLDPDFQTGSGFNSTVNVLLVQPDGKILAGGWFTSFNGQPKKYLVRLLENGQLDATFNPGGVGINYWVYTLSMQEDNKIIVGGSFTKYNDINAHHLARLHPDGSLDESYFLTGKPDGYFLTSDIDKDGHLLVGGQFTSVNGFGRNRLARLFARCIPTESFLQTTACDSLEWNGVTYTSSGIYSFSTVNALGCDSLATIELTITTIDSTVLVENNTLTSLETDADQYQWLDCRSLYSPIAGATERIFTPVETGNFAVEITKGVCKDTSACYRVIITSTQDQRSQVLNVFPSITQDMITFIVPTELVGKEWILTNAIGKVFEIGRFTQPTESSDISHLPAGMYFVRVNGANVAKLVKM